MGGCARAELYLGAGFIILHVSYGWCASFNTNINERFRERVTHCNRRNAVSCVD